MVLGRNLKSIAVRALESALLVSWINGYLLLIGR